MIFATDERPDLPVRSSRLGRTLQFSDGRFETNDPEEIAALRRNPLVREHVDPSKQTRADLNAAALAAGVEAPEQLPNKDAVVAAIEEAKAREGDAAAE